MTDEARDPNFWDHRMETISREELSEIQLERLRATVLRLYRNVPFYRKRLNEAGVAPQDIRSLEDLRRLPVTTKDDLRAHYPYGLTAAPMEDIVRFHASTGTTGTPTVVGYTRRDLDTWADLVARLAAAAGVKKSDIAHIAFGYGLFTGGFGLHYGLERLGAAVLPVSGGNTERQVRILREMRPTVLVATPSYSLHIAEVLLAEGFSIDDIALRVGLFGGESWTEAMRREIEERLGLSATDNYGLSEIIGPGVAGECWAKSGMHIAEDHFLAEHLDPDTLEPVAPGELGELVVTPLTREGFSVLRYRTRDLCRVLTEPCPCGRTHRRMTKVIGRSDDMLIVRGVNLFPSQVEQALVEIADVEPHYQIVLTREGTMDAMEIKVEVLGSLFSDEMRRLRETEKRIEQRLRSALGVSFKLTLVEPGALERGAGKARRVLDRRRLI